MPILPSGIPDEETQAILDEMKEEGVQDESDPRKKDESESKDEEEPADNNDGESEDEEEDKEEKKDEEQKKDEEEKEEKEEEEEDEDDDEEEEEDKKKIVSLKKHQKTKEKLKAANDELKRQLDEAMEKNREFEGKLAERSLRKEVKTISEKHGLDEEAVMDILSLAGKTVSSSVSQEDIKAIREMSERAKQDPLFESDYKENASEVVETLFPDLPESKSSAIKAKVKELAFHDEDSAKLPLATIISRNIQTLKKLAYVKPAKKTAESQKSGTQAGGAKKDLLAELDKNGGADLSDEEFNQASELAAKRDKSKSYKLLDE